MFSKLFIDRPILASVISITIVLAGLTALKYLPVELYPNIVPPQVSVSTVYPGASATDVADTVASPLEQAINGSENMLYMQSQSGANGSMGLDVLFDIGTDIDKAYIDVQNRVNGVTSGLPNEVQQVGVTVQKRSSSFLLIVALQSQDDRYDPIFVSNFASLNVAEDLKRIKGVSDVTVFGAGEYSMRIWLKPDQMAQLSITMPEIVNAIRVQNAQYPIGQIGAPPTPSYVDLTFPIVTRGRLTDPSQYENIILRATPQGSIVRIKDIGRVELGAENYDMRGELNGRATTLLGVSMQFGANSLHVSNEVQEALEELSQHFPYGISYSIPYDNSRFDKASIREVIETVILAAILVILVMFFFLQNLRATLIPITAMIVSILGTFAVMYVLGFSLNSLTLFGLVLAIGIVVDDAIVVVENVERNMREKNLSPKEAALLGMREVTGPVIAIVFVLCAVFIPVAFLGGIAGQLYKQFAITITISVVISGLVALTLSPALAAALLKPHSTSRFSLWFHRRFDRMTNYYMNGTKWLIRFPLVGMALYVVFVGVVYIFMQTIPKSFVPAEDKGYFIMSAQLPDAASLDRTQRVTNVITEETLQNPAIESLFAFTGYSFLDGNTRPNAGTYFAILKDWKERKSTKLSVTNVIKELNAKYEAVPQAVILPFNPPPISGLGKVGGFECWVQNRTDKGRLFLSEAVNKLVEKASKRKELVGVSASNASESLQLFIDVDRDKAKAYGVELNEIFVTLQGLFGSIYVNDFNKFGRVFKVKVQAEPIYRLRLSDIRQIYVRSSYNKMIPLTSIVDFHFNQGPALASRFDGFMAMQITGNAAPDYSSGQAIAAMEEVALEVLPEGMSLEWSGAAFQEKRTGGTSFAVLLTGILMIFLILAALYNRWALPISILLVVPLGNLGAFLAIWLMGISDDIYFQIGLITLVALNVKNAILIIEFAHQKRKEGLNAVEAAVTAARLRFRAILMTSLTFIFGVLPLVFTRGAGAASRHSVGTGVLGGMIAATCLGIFFVPLFYTLIERKREK